MEFYKKQKICYQFFVAFVESTLNFQHFEKKHQTHSSTKSEDIDSKISFSLIIWKAFFRTPLGTDCVDWSKKLMKSNQEQLAQWFHFRWLNWDGKHVSWQHLKSDYCLLTHWLPMASIVVIKPKNSDTSFQCNYTKN